MQFSPRYIEESELDYFGLPDVDTQKNILALVDGASAYIDEYCGRTDVNGSGSLVYTTYSERLYLPEGRNIVRLSFRPFAPISPSVQQTLIASGGQGQWNHFYTGFTPNTVLTQNGSVLSPLISISGRYGYSRRGSQQVYPDLNYGANLLQIASFFGGPPGFTPVDISQVDVDVNSGELWFPAGLYLSQYTEVVVTYNVGFDPTNLPVAIKHATSMLIRNLLARGGGTTGLKSMNASRINMQFTDDLVDTTVDRMLQKFKVVYAM